MKRALLAFVVLALVAGFAGGSQAAVYSDPVDVYQYAVGPATISWSHAYDFSLTPPLVATLTIVADDVDGTNPATGLPEQDAVWFNGHFLGYLVDMGYYTNWNYEPGPGNSQQPLTTTVFNIDPSWLALNMPASVSVDSNWGVEIETSTLTIQSVPEPSMLLLLLSGLMGVWGLKKLTN